MPLLVDPRVDRGARQWSPLQHGEHLTERDGRQRLLLRIRDLLQPRMQGAAHREKDAEADLVRSDVRFLRNSRHSVADQSCMNTSKQNRWLTMTMVAALWLGGCAMPASPAAMTVSAADVPGAARARFAHEVVVHDVQGGTATNPLLTSQIENDGFRRALHGSLERAGLLGNEQTARYRVDVTLIEVQQPAFGFDMKVTSKIRYVVSNVKTGATALAIEVVAPYTATVGDSIVGSSRLKIANEGSARQSIAALLKRMTSNETLAGQRVAAR